jgi:hypothetical protein
MPCRKITIELVVNDEDAEGVMQAFMTPAKTALQNYASMLAGQSLRVTSMRANPRSTSGRPAQKGRAAWLSSCCSYCRSTDFKCSLDDGRAENGNATGRT